SCASIIIRQKRRPILERMGMPNAWISIPIISSLISGIWAAIISIFYYRRAEKIKAKIETLKNFCGYRYDLRGGNFTKRLMLKFKFFFSGEGKCPDAMSGRSTF
ncbi:MAG: hypothetical protein PHH75_04235, partial [Candidatus Omnitrophica bacterium]|nr:hypothetical protein [Candidatus Omnitrophota bacterium]